eukprot:Colp12_sorted_trinity150504_noHs@7209
MLRVGGRSLVRTAAHIATRTVVVRAAACKISTITHTKLRSSGWALPQIKTFKRLYADLPAHFAIAMPALSPTMTQGNLAAWHKNVGDKVAPGDVLAEIETDKATMEFEAAEEGYLAKVFIPAGAKDVPVGSPLCIIAESADDVAKFANVEGAAPK